jgi:RNA 3'-terminal phosphate cyclase (ATP)
VGTAGSATLVLQTVLPALLIAENPSSLVLEGGTHNPWAPPFEFLDRAFLPLVNRMGPRVTATLQRAGFYPAGGGRLTVTVQPCSRLVGFDLLERGPIVSHSVCALVANLPVQIAEREVNTMLSGLDWEAGCGQAKVVEADGPGNVVMIELVSQQVTEVFAAFGRKGVRAERVAEEAIQQAADYWRSGVPVGSHLADQLLLPLGISAWQTENAAHRGGGSFHTLPLTRHSTTHIEILRQFLGIEIRVDNAAGAETCQVSVRPTRSR